MFSLFYMLLQKVVYSFHYRVRKNKSLLQDKLLRNGQVRWLDMGASKNYSQDFFYCDIIEPEDVPAEIKNKYFKFDATKPLSQKDIDLMGKYDFIRMQHVFEHFTPEDSLIVLSNCYELLNPDGLLLITVPDLRKHMTRYFFKASDKHWSFADWAKTRIKAASPPSFYFSVFAHSVPHQPHLWCYDREGLEFQIKQSGKFKNIKRLGVFSSLSGIPFTHNRPMEDLCILAQRA